MDERIESAGSLAAPCPCQSAPDKGPLVFAGRHAMRPGRTVLMCQANLVVCPHCRSQQPITVGTRANRHAGRNQFRGRGTTACECGGEFMFHTADGGTVVIALWGDEAAHLDMDEPLPRIWARLGLLQVA